MNEKVLQVLEYNKIIGMLENKATSPLGKALALSLKPGSDLEEINKATDHDNFMTANEAIEFGLCDKVATRIA